MEENSRSKMMKQLIADFEKGIQFHAVSFREIDDKAKYWLTLALPSLFGLIGYGFQQGQELSPYLMAVFSSVSVCLFAAIYFFARTLDSVSVSGGIARPQSSEFNDLFYFLENPAHWTEYEEEKAKTAFEALELNERCNERKALRLKYAERLLFLGVPSAAFLTVGLAFADSRITHWWPGTAAASVTAGIVVGASVSATLLIVAHRRIPKPTH
jgi:hypothetical protein